ncbi:YheV family putative zinc ribbon protein [Halioxenophilus sp. WMMB6]|uniref:YheV family putative zinc ribbon protein n=1 Tax=Halioxenophilus sp. WMMB6 TaxID=3073815 RepID=UPI00295F3BEF|nr:YheV family putative zinc ribbon protein [Halioxenophilus sp. WMMB6]
MNDAKPPVTKRFIAGAVCPRCGEMDKLMMYRQDGADFRECKACGFNDQLHIQPQLRELETRVNTPEEVKEAETQVVTLLPLSNKPPSSET